MVCIVGSLSFLASLFLVRSRKSCWFILWEQVKLKTGLPVGVPQKSDIYDIIPYYDHTADPFTLDLVGLKARWIEYKRKHGIV